MTYQSHPIGSEPSLREMMAHSVKRLPLLLVLGYFFQFGCGKDESIRTYRVAEPTGKEKQTTASAPAMSGTSVPSIPLSTGPDKARILGAIIPTSGGSSYFVKFVGPIEKIEPYEKDFDAFLSSIRVTGDPGKPLTWSVPSGWQEAPARSMRLLTLNRIDGKGADLYISQPFGGTLLDNVNRWRTGDAGLPKISQDDLSQNVREVQLGGIKAFRVDFRGPGGTGGMSGPFVK